MVEGQAEVRHDRHVGVHRGHRYSGRVRHDRNIGVHRGHRYSGRAGNSGYRGEPCFRGCVGPAWPGRLSGRLTGRDAATTSADDMDQPCQKTEISSKTEPRKAPEEAGAGSWGTVMGSCLRGGGEVGRWGGSLAGPVRACVHLVCRVWRYAREEQKLNNILLLMYLSLSALSFELPPVELWSHHRVGMLPAEAVPNTPHSCRTTLISPASCSPGTAVPSYPELTQGRWGHSGPPPRKKMQIGISEYGLIMSHQLPNETPKTYRI